MTSTPGCRDATTILVVDDERNALEFAKASLRSLDYRVIAVASARAALKLLKSRRDIDLLFTDIVMPDDLDGFTLADRAKKLRPCIRVLYATAYSNVRAQVSSRYGKVIGKPYRVEELKNEILEALAGCCPRDCDGAAVARLSGFPLAFLVSALMWGAGYLFYRMVLSIGAD
jgi:CheY-like chemotaxis protein